MHYNWPRRAATRRLPATAQRPHARPAACAACVVKRSACATVALTTRGSPAPAGTTHQQERWLGGRSYAGGPERGLAGAVA